MDVRFLEEGPQNKTRCFRFHTSILTRDTTLRLYYNRFINGHVMLISQPLNINVSKNQANKRHRFFQAEQVSFLAICITC